MHLVARLVRWTLRSRWTKRHITQDGYKTLCNKVIPRNGEHESAELLNSKACDCGTCAKRWVEQNSLVVSTREV
jgi:hypothetical protein